MKSLILSLWMVRYILLTSLKTRISTAYNTRKKEEINDEMEATKSILVAVLSTNARKVVVISEIRNANIKAIKRGLKDMLNVAVGFWQPALGLF